MLSYDEFIEKARATPNEAPDPRFPDKDWSDLWRPKELPGDCFWVSWRTGGMEGGNCWETGRNYPLNPEPEPPQLHGLVALLEGLDVRLREAMVIQGDIVEGGKASDRGYYGNYVDYGFKYITFDDVYERLVEFGYAHPRQEEPTP